VAWILEHLGSILGAFWNPVGSNMSENGGPKISKKTGVQKGRKKVMQSEKKSCRTSACGPLKELSTAEQQTADLQGLRDTPLVPRGHGGGYLSIYLQIIFMKNNIISKCASF